jgi:hypothetical protein
LEEMPREEPQGKPSDLHKRLFRYIVAVEEGKSPSFEDRFMKKVADDRDARETAEKHRREESAALLDKANNIAKTLADTSPFGTPMTEWLGAESGKILSLGLDAAWTGQTTYRHTLTAFLAAAAANPRGLHFWNPNEHLQSPGSPL